MNQTPRWVWRGALMSVAFVVVGVGGGALLLALGAADPPVAGPLAIDVTPADLWLPDAQTQMFADGYTLSSPSSALTAEVEASLAGPADASYGLWLQGCEAAERVVFALDGEGYAAWFMHPAKAAPPWAWFLHARPRPAGNRLRLHLAGGALSLRVNDELAGVRTNAQIEQVCALGVYAATETAGGARVHIERLRVWAADHS